MSEEKKEEGCCSTKASGCGCGCGSGMKLIVGLLLGAFIFAAGMCFAKHCGSAHNFCPFSAPATK